MKFPSIIFENEEEQSKINALAPTTQAAPGEKPQGPLVISRKQEVDHHAATSIPTPALGAQRVRKVFKKAVGQEGMVAVQEGPVEHGKAQISKEIETGPYTPANKAAAEHDTEVTTQTIPPELASLTKKEIRVVTNKGRTQLHHPVTADSNDPSLVSLKVRVDPNTQEVLNNLGDISLVLHAGNEGNSVLAPEGVDISQSLAAPIPTVSLHHSQVQMVPVMMVPVLAQPGQELMQLNAVQPLYPYVQANPTQPIFVAPVINTVEEIPVAINSPAIEPTPVMMESAPQQEEQTDSTKAIAEESSVNDEESPKTQEEITNSENLEPQTIEPAVTLLDEKIEPTEINTVSEVQTVVIDRPIENENIAIENIEAPEQETAQIAAVGTFEIQPVVPNLSKAPVVEDIYEIRKYPKAEEIKLNENSDQSGNAPQIEISQEPLEIITNPPGATMTQLDAEEIAETLPPLQITTSESNQQVETSDQVAPQETNSELEMSEEFVAPVEAEEIPSTIEESDPTPLELEPEESEPVVIVMDVAPENTVPKKPSPLTFIEKPVYAKPLSLHQRCFSLDLKGVASFLENGANPIGLGHVVDDDGNTHSGLTPLQAILLATELGSEEIAPKMLKKQAARIVKLLLSRGALTSEMEKDLAFYCVTKDLPEVMQVLFENNMKLRRHGYDMVGLALQIGHKDILKSLEKFNCPINIKNDRGNRPFLDICSKTLRVDVPKKHRKTTVDELTSHIRNLVEYGLNLESIDYVGSTALVRAVASGNEAMMWALINCGANPRVKFKNGVTLPHLAAACLSPSSFRSFLDQTGTHAELRQLNAKNLQPDIRSMILSAKRA